jgi:serine/threonine protein kinase
MIVFNPEKRYSVEECLNHPYVKSIKDEDTTDPVFKGKINFDFELIENADNEFFINLLISELSTYDTGIYTV